MINFKEELQKFKPILEVDDIEDSIHSDELQDLLDILNHLSSAVNKDKDANGKE